MAERRRVTWSDLGLAAVLGFVALAGTGPAAANQGTTAPPAAYLLAVTAAVATVAWRWRPSWTLATAGGATVVYLALGYAYGPILFALVVAVYGVSSRYPVRRGLAGTGGLLAAVMAAIGIGVATGEREWAEFLTAATWLVVPAAVGIVVKVRRDAAADVRDARARRAVSEERLQLAQEVHDVVGHGLAVIAMQAGVALRVLDRDSARARTAVETIRATSTEALDSLRAELDALRQQAPPPDAPHRPRTGLADLPGLADRIRSSGLPVTVERDGELPDLPAGVDHAAYRIIQEALTNVLRHGGPQATARVRLRRAAAALELEVRDTGYGGAGSAGAGGAGAAPAEAGHGIAGMRERATRLGGTLSAGPDPAGGFTVRARLPWPPGAAAGEHATAGGGAA